METRRWIPWLLAAGGWLFFAAPVGAIESITLQLKWTHAFQFAGYYAAKEQGYYREAGLEVRIEEALPGVDPVEKVLQGQAEFGVGTSSLLLHRQAGQPVVALAVIFQHSPLVLIARQQQSTQGIHDLVGKRVMLEPQSDELLAYLKQESIPLEHIDWVEHSANPQDLIDGKVDAMSAYVTSEPYYLDRAHFSYQVYTPRSAGIDFYGDTLFTTEAVLKAHPDRVKAFRNASLRGWQYAMQHPEEIVDLILAKYSQRHRRDYYLFEARQMIPLIQPVLVEMGYMNPGRWRHIADTYADIDLLPHHFSLDGFLYDPNPKPNLTWIYLGLAFALLLLGMIGGVTFYIYRINRQLGYALRQSQQTEIDLRKLSIAIEQSPVSVVITDLNTVIQYVNPCFTQVTGYTAAEAIGQKPHILNSGLTAKTVFREMWSHLAHGNSWTGEFINRRKNGEIYYEEACMSAVTDANGRATHYIAVKLDITERKRVDEALRISEERHRLLADNATDVIWTMNLEGEFTYISPSVEKLRGYSAAEVMQQSIEQALTPESAALALNGLGSLIKAVQTGQPLPDFRGELEQPCKDGSTVWTETTVTAMYNAAGEFKGLLGITRDITERRQMQEALREQAIRDPLTGLFNRGYLDETLPRELHRCQRSGDPLAVAMLDLDHFKRFNDAHGHSAGDSVLRAVGELLNRSLRGGDLACRYGGEELTVVMPGSSLIAAEARLEKLRQAVMELRVPYPAGELPAITVSIGVAAEESVETDAAALLNRADAALYQAKAQGRNCIVTSQGVDQ
jgi:diguanylate cyclase (GGDEF)-like protein/PAS domain S-box-containing protein